MAHLACEGVMFVRLAALIICYTFFLSTYI